MIERPILLLLPGLLCTRDLWRDQITAFEQSFDVLVPKLGGHSSIAAMARACLSLVDRHRAGASFNLAGLSMGGYVSLELIRQAPERVRTLALLDTSARADTPEQRVRREALINMASVGQFKGVTDRLLPLLVHENRLGDGELTDRIKAMAAEVGKQVFFNQQSAILERVDSRPHLSEITCPTLVICGQADALTPPEVSQEIAAHVPEARLEMIADCGHLSSMEQPETVNSHLKALFQL